MTTNRTHVLLWSVFLGVSAAEPLWAQRADTLAPGENLVVDGVPPIPAALADRVRRYTEYRSANLTDWHPTRRQMLISTRFGNTNQIHRVRMPGGARAQLTFYDEPITNATYQPTRGRYFLFGKDVGGNPPDQISFSFVGPVSCATAPPLPLFDAPEGQVKVE